MQRSAVGRARTLFFVESLELNPCGKAFYPDIITGLVERCGFQQFPQKLEDFDEKKGVELNGGKRGDAVIETLKIYHTGLQVDTRVSTAESERIIEEALNRAIGELGIVYEPKMVNRKAYVSDLILRTDAPILGSCSPIAKLSETGQAA